MSPVSTNTDDQTQIRARLEAFAEAARHKDLDAITSFYAPDIVSFDAILQLRFKGVEAYRKHWEACLSCIQGPMLFEIHDLDIAAHGDVAFCHYLSRCGGCGQDGKEHAGWMRATAGLRKTKGTWMIVHEHYSAPFDPVSGKALFDLLPEGADRASAA